MVTFPENAKKILALVLEEGTAEELIHKLPP